MAIVSLQSAASALTALNTSMDVIANNLANVNTPGFKASRANFEDLLYQEKSQPGVENASGDQRPLGLYVGLGTRVSGTQLDFQVGSPIPTGRPLDMYINGMGFFRVRVQDELGTGGLAYTRAGQFTKNAEGEIVMANDQGRRLDVGFTIPEDATEVSVDSNGRVFALVPGEAEPQELGQIELALFVNPAGLKQVGENMYVETAASGPPISGVPGTENFGEVQSKQYEGSNVDPTRELIELIRTQRAFEMNSNTIRAADESLRTIAQLRR
ncbi:MAG TPA: flagellar basal-body rod protein FlgG [Phycisphaerales bacterium]|nr:flagellar basal-body rod protein FlgG [Phycisphaerales bacterium]